jgi:hypothetical protein
MATTAGKRTEAKQLYIRKSMNCPEIAAELGVGEGTVYRWKAEAAEKGEAMDWEYQRQFCMLSPDELKSIFRQTITAMIMGLKNSTTPLDTKQADALAKLIKVMERLDADIPYFTAIIDLIKVTNGWIAVHQSELKEKLAPHWDSIRQELVNYASRKGLF